MTTKFLALKVSRALIARILFALHSIIGIWRLTTDTKDIYHWLFALAPICLFLEGAVTILWRHGDEYKWFCPSVFIFLCGSVPPIWLLELRTSWKIQNNQTNFDDNIHSNEEIVLAGVLRVLLPETNRQKWLQLLEQSLLVILILGRWLLPKGRITRDELSQLLLAYLAISADIVELFNLFNELDIRKNMKLNFVLLGIWTVSLIQFPMVLTTVKSQKARYCWPSTKSADGSIVLSAHSPNGSRRSSVTKKSKTRLKWTEKLKDISAWGILSTVVLQDGPFFSFRVYLYYWEGIFSYTTFFFLSKNSLIIMVQLYRLLVICCDNPSSMSAATTVDDENQNIPINQQERWTLLDRNGSVESNHSTPRKQQEITMPRICSSDLADL